MFTDILIGDFVNPFMDRVLGSLAIFSPVQVCGSFPTLYVFGKVKFRTTFKPLVVRARPHVPHSTMWTNLYIFRFGSSNKDYGNVMTIDSAFTEDNDSFHPSISFQSCQNPCQTQNQQSLSSFHHMLMEIREQVRTYVYIYVILILKCHRNFFML